MYIFYIYTQTQTPPYQVSEHCAKHLLAHLQGFLARNNASVVGAPPGLKATHPVR